MPAQEDQRHLDVQGRVVTLQRSTAEVTLRFRLAFAQRSSSSSSACRLSSSDRSASTRSASRRSASRRSLLACAPPGAPYGDVSARAAVLPRLRPVAQLRASLRLRPGCVRHPAEPRRRVRPRLAQSPGDSPRPAPVPSRPSSSRCAGTRSAWSHAAVVRCRSAKRGVRATIPPTAPVVAANKAIGGSGVPGQWLRTDALVIAGGIRDKLQAGIPAPSLSLRPQQNAATASRSLPGIGQVAGEIRERGRQMWPVTQTANEPSQQVNQRPSGYQAKIDFTDGQQAVRHPLI